MRYIVAFAVYVTVAVLISQTGPPREQVGPLPDGGFLLNSGWRLQPAGRQVPLDTFPMSSALSRDGKYLVVLHGGYKPPSLVVLDTQTMTEVSRTAIDDGWLGLTFSPDGKLLYVGGGSRACVYEFQFLDGKLQPTRTFPIVAEASRTHRDFIGDVALSPDGRLIYAAGLFHDAIHVINPQSGRVIDKFPTGRRPYRILFHPDGRSYFVSSWADAAVYHHNANSGERISLTRVGQHPTDMLWRPRGKQDAQDAAEAASAPAARLFVTAGNTNSVYVLGVSEAKDVRPLETINVAMRPRQPLGMTPSALATDADQTRLFVVCSDANAVAVVDITDERSVVLGFIPTGWYPTAVRVLPQKQLVVFNGRGARSFPNLMGPNPMQRPAITHEGDRPAEVQHVGRIQTGTASVIEPFDEQQLTAYTQTVLRNSPYRDEVMDRLAIPAGNPIPSRPGEPSPIKHVIYIVKENRTYDQVLGDMEKGNNDPKLTLFGEKITPNHHKLAREFVLFDNFYVNADVSADGHNWSTSAIAPDYVQKMWPNSYGGRRKHYDYEGGEVAALPPAGYIWTNAISAGVSLRNYGWWVNNTPKVAPEGSPQIASVRDPALAKFTNMHFRGYDLNYKDVGRAAVFIKELAEFERAGQMPQLILLRIGNDHTSGTAAGAISPYAAVADNDAALGEIVQAVSRSKFWPATAIFVLEDDAQNGPDHVDSHRSPAFVISPYTRRGIVDSSMYNTTSMLRTIELIVGLRPMTHFDAAARPMWAAFADKPDTAPYTAEKPRVSLDERNPAGTALAARSAKLDFSEADRIDDDEMNEILWRALRTSEPPAPVRSIFSR
ncbi:MAG TPA: bifunctional YncE family protein/alkaline phosphatase family protein [Bryobacteraceae bacterium]|nr:bifunctional YncE family protein/alkaline phosphatase family protein [Bryobacteraceae bacterium]